MDDSGQPGDAPGGGGNPPASRDGDAWADRDRDSGTRSAWHRSRYANLLTPIVPASRQPRQQVNGSSEVHSASAPPYPYEGDLEDAAPSQIPAQTGGDPDWRGWAPPPAADEPLPEPPSPWAPGWAPAPGNTPPAPVAPPADGTVVVPGPFASAFPPAPPVRFRPRQDEPPRPAGDGQPPAAPPDPAGGGFPPIGSVAAGAPTDNAPPGTPTEADPYPPDRGFPPPAPPAPPAPAARRPDWAPEWPWSPAPPAPTSPTAIGRLQVPAPRPTQPEPPPAAPTPPGAAAPAPDDGTLPSRRDFQPPARNTLPGYIRGGAGPSGDEARFTTGSHPTVPAPQPPDEASGGFTVVEPERGRVERTASGSFPVVDRRSAGLTRSFPANDPADPPVTPGRLTRAFPGGAGAPAAPQGTPLTAAFPGGGDQVPPVESPAPAGANRPTDLSGRSAARPPAPVSPAAGDVPAPPALRLASRNGDPIDDSRPAAARTGRREPAGERPATDRTSRGFADAPTDEPQTGGFTAPADGRQRAFPGQPTSGGPAGDHQTGGFPTGDSARRGFAGGPTSGGPAGGGQPGRFPDGDGARRGFAAEPTSGGPAGGGQPGRSPAGDGAQRGLSGRPAGGGPAEDEQGTSGFAAGDGARRGFRGDAGGSGFAGDSAGGGFAREGFAGDQAGGAFGGSGAAGGFTAERANGGFGGEATNGGFGDEPPPIPLNQRPIERPQAEPRSVVDDMIDELSGLPQRVPAEPDVPTVPEPPSDVPADPPQLARIATHLRRPDLPEERDRPDGFDVEAILAAVRGVSGVKDASLRTTPAGAHSLRLDLSDGADPADISRHVARLLQERMGLAAAPQNLPGMTPGEPPAAPLGGDTPPTGFSRSGGYVPPPPAEPAPRAAAPTKPAPRPAEATRPVPRPADPARPVARPNDPASPSAHPSEPARPSTHPAEPPRPSAGPSDSPRPSARPGEPLMPPTRPAELPRPIAEAAESAAHPAEATRPAPRPAESADAQSVAPAQPPGFEPPPDPAQRAAGSHRGRAQVGAQSGVDTHDLAQRAAAAAASVSGPPQHGVRPAEPAPHRRATDDADRGRLYGGNRESDLRTGADQPASGSFPEIGSAAGIIGNIGGHPVTAAATAYSGGQISTTESAPSRPLNPGANPGPRVVIDHVQVSTFGLDATVETRLAAGKRVANGLATGPAVDGYVLRLCAVSAATAIDELLRTASRADDRGRCFVEHAAVIPFGNCEVAVVVVLLVCGGWIEQLAGSALVSGDPRQGVVRATLAAVNRRLEALLSD